LHDFTNQPLEGSLPEEEISGLLITTDLAESNHSWTVTMWPPQTTIGRNTPAGGLRGKLLTRGFSTSRLSRCLLGPRHVRLLSIIVTKTCQNTTNSQRQTRTDPTHSEPTHPPDHPSNTACLSRLLHTFILHPTFTQVSRAHSTHV